MLDVRVSGLRIAPRLRQRDRKVKRYHSLWLPSTRPISSRYAVYEVANRHSDHAPPSARRSVRPSLGTTIVRNATDLCEATSSFGCHLAPGGCKEKNMTHVNIRAVRRIAAAL